MAQIKITLEISVDEARDLNWLIKNTKHMIKNASVHTEIGIRAFLEWQKLTLSGLESLTEELEKVAKR